MSNSIGTTPTNLARHWLALGMECLILDTETTGLDESAQIIEISAIDMTGAPVIDTRIRPTAPIPPETTDIHGITDADVAGCPTWEDFAPEFARMVKGRRVLIYNAPYDLRLLAQSARVNGLTADPALEAGLADRAECVARTYAAWFGQWDHKRNRHKHQRLVQAAERFGLPTDQAHSALADCRMTLGVIRGMAGEDPLAAIA